MILRFLLASILLTSIGLHVSLLHAQEADRPKIGLALSGGGARGGAHVGVLQALEQMGIPIDYIAGTSMGAIIGGFYAAGYSADEINEILKTTDWSKALTDRAARIDRTMRKKELEAQFLIPYRIGFNKGKIQLPLGAIEGQHLDQIFHRLLYPIYDIKEFEQLPIPFRAVATDLVTGEPVVLSKGSLPDALRASMSVPGVFAPVRIEDRLLVDGGMANNLPVDIVRDMGADIVIAVDISAQLLTEEQLRSVLSVTEQLTNFLVRRTTDAQIESLGPMDILIVPDLGTFSSADFENAFEIVKNGLDATFAEKDRLEQLTSGFHIAAREVPKLSKEVARNYQVNFIDLFNDSKLSDDLIRSRLDIEMGETIDLDEFNSRVDNIYSLDVFDSVTYNLVSNDAGESGVEIYASPRDWGPNYMQFGLELSSDFSGASDFNLGAAYTRNALNELGGELRVLASLGREDELSFDFYQPINKTARWFIQPRTYLRRENIGVWVEDDNIATIELKRFGFDFGIGRNFNTRNRVDLFYRFGRGDADVVTGDIDVLVRDRLEIGELALGYTHDSLDSLWFPTEGATHHLSYLYADDALGADFDYEQFIADGGMTHSFGRNTLLVNYEIGYSFDDNVPAERWFQLGGFARLSGLAPNQLWGRQAALLTVGMYRRLNDSKVLPLFVGGTVEAGNVWQSKDQVGLDDLRYSASLYMGAETPLGPVYVALGANEGGNGAVYFYLGNPFRVSRFE